LPPFTPGLEAAGTVDKLGPGVQGLEVGQRVTVHADGGSYSEYVLARSVGVFPIPDTLDWETAACFPSVGTTSFNLLTQAGRLQPGETVLIHAAAGGIGSTAVQLARTLGAGLIIGTVGSEEKAKLIKELGADVAINYRKEDVPARVREVTGGALADLVLDGVGKDTFEGSIQALAPFGRLVVFGQSSGPPPPVAFGPIYGENKSIIGYSTGGHRRTRPEALRAPGLAALKLLTQGRWKPIISAHLPLPLLFQGRGISTLKQARRDRRAQRSKLHTRSWRITLSRRRSTRSWDPSHRAGRKLSGRLPSPFRGGDGGRGRPPGLA
jgi:NADPH:quinone reductase